MLLPAQRIATTTSDSGLLSADQPMLRSTLLLPITDLVDKQQIGPAGRCHCPMSLPWPCQPPDAYYIQLDAARSKSTLMNQFPQAVEGSQRKRLWSLLASTSRLTHGAANGCHIAQA